MILDPGTFRTSEYRKAIPDAVKVEVVQRTIRVHFEATGELHPIAYVPAKTIRYDHRPRLEERPYDTEAGDFIPKQNDPAHIEPLSSKEHDYRTFGRKPDAERIVTTRGSDVGEAAHIRKVQQNEAAHKERMANRRTAITAAQIGLDSENPEALGEALKPLAREGLMHPKPEPRKKSKYPMNRKRSKHR